MSSSNQVRLSKSAIRKCGSIIRDHHSGKVPLDVYDKAIKTLNHYRREISPYLEELTEYAEKSLKTLQLKGEVTKRLKRQETIVEKLSERECGMDLSRMQDIGGCRIVLEPSDTPSLDELYQLRDYIKQAYPSIKREYDYVSQPRKSGYRAIHLVFEIDGYLLELQLRTFLMHFWAQFVEDLSYELQVNYKQDTDHPGKNFFLILSQLHNLIESNATVSENEVHSLLDNIQTELAKMEALVNLHLPNEIRNPRRPE